MFAGTGVTGRACKRHGREFIGCDLDGPWVVQGNADIAATSEVPEGTPVVWEELEPG
jgi:adenine-specific DNA methylase